jgi:norsolorinic acid ketoreductase
LEKGVNAKFVTMSSSVANISGMETRPVPNAAYGPSKAALNYLTRNIHFEDPNLTAFSIDPEYVDFCIREKKLL